MRVLGIDTATATGSVALLDGEQVVGEYLLNIQATHSERLLPALVLILEDAGWSGETIDGIAVATGPGSFTGLRIGVATAKALAYTWGKPLIGVTVLEGLAFQVGFAAEWVTSLVDARHGEVYGCLYRVNGIPEMVTQYWAGPIGDFLQEVVAVAQAPICFAGDGAVAYWETITEIVGNGAKRPISNSIHLRASSIALLGRQRLLAGERHDPLALAPLYLRLAEAERKLRAKRRKCR
ncbi:MAG: tRNA (adenosine(37)-N6)-threonylcarbamoyltransferase complex dimerization subunit type 1 TsaB [Firmicutes bacterium]|jgi:tRNA threonylcarbamoyladenosine biosynthesis protein TsaB|nr:tRNA (adenosine(37)-N6)-threonylcarbamoyltransferase complex dimerization subunit type 1 TsaB [Bacillota bacterium]